MGMAMDITERLLSWVKAFARWWNAARILGAVLLVLGIASAVRGFDLLHPGPFDLVAFVTEFYANVSTELVSIALTILVIDGLNERRSKSERKRAIIQQMGSPVNDAALEAVRIARIEGWLEDGSLRGAWLQNANLEAARLVEAHLPKAYLGHANLQEAKLGYANLERANLPDAHLEGADLPGVNLQGAELRRTNLQRADLRWANLQGASLVLANLQEAELLETQFDQNTILPDSTWQSESKWTPDTDMTHFTDPSHLEFYDVEKARQQELDEREELARQVQANRQRQQ